MLRKIACIEELNINKSKLNKLSFELNSSSIKVDLDFKHVLGLNRDIYICISKLNTCLDYEPIRKIKANTDDLYKIIDIYESAITNQEDYVI